MSLREKRLRMKREKSLQRKARLLLVLYGNDHEAAFQRDCLYVCKYYNSKKTGCPDGKSNIKGQGFHYCIEWLDPENRPKSHQGVV